MRRIFFLIALCSAFACLYSQNIQVAILEPIAMTKEVTIMHSSMVRGEMVKAIGRQNGYAAFNRADIDQIMKEHNFQQSGMVDEATRKRLGTMQGVDCVCITKITKEGNNYYLEANLVHIETGQISNPASQYGELQDGSLANMLTACEKLAAELVGAQSIAYNSTTSTQSYVSSTIEQQYKKGRDYLNAENYIEALNILKPLAEQGHAAAQLALGWCYETGNGVTQDYYAAVSWYRKSAEQGYARAQCSLGWCYEYGKGVTQDYYAAVSWYRKAAEQGNARAQFSLGWCYDTGKGVTQDYYAAVSWYRKAAEQGHARAQCNLGWCYETGKGVTQDYYAAVSWYRKSAEQGHAYAQYSLGWCYEYGEGVTKNIDEAIKWYKKAVENGSESAQERLDELQFNSSNSSSTIQQIMGNNKTITGNNKIIMGNNNIIRGNNNKIVGNNNTIIGNNNMITGNNNKATGNNNKATGNNNKLTPA